MKKYCLAIAISIEIGSTILSLGCGGSTSVKRSVEDELSQLAAADQVEAREQKLCLVSGEALGSMGVRIKVEVDDRHFYICCQGCQQKAIANFDNYYTKVVTKRN